jgi:hypothetical protein
VAVVVLVEVADDVCVDDDVLDAVLELVWDEVAVLDAVLVAVADDV